MLGAERPRKALRVQTKRRKQKETALFQAVWAVVVLKVAALVEVVEAVLVEAMMVEVALAVEVSAVVLEVLH